jgi:hypothetical protein
VLYPTWAASGAVTAALRPKFEEGAVSDWGALAADESRQQAVDDALDSLPDGGLLAVVRGIARAEKPSTLAEVAAVEATVAALGRRLLKADVHLSSDAVATTQQLMLRQLDSLVVEPGYGQVHHPFTRRTQAEWFATGWAVSLRIPAPKRFSRDDLAWEIPGWARHLSLADVPQHGFPSSYVDPWGASEAVQLVAALAPEVLDRMKPGVLPANADRVLLPALFLSPSAWQLDRGHLDALQGSWEERFLSNEAADLPDDARARIASRIWDLASFSIVDGGAVPVAERIAYLRHRHPGLVAFVLANMSPSRLADTARAHGVHRRPGGAGSFYPSDPRELLALSRQGRQAALRGWLDGAAARGASFDEARELVALLDPEDIDLAIDLARRGDRNIAAEFTGFVWLTAPARAREEASSALERGLPSAEGWLHTAPRAELGLLACHVSELPNRPAWAGRWAMRRVLDGGEAAETLFRLARQDIA